MTENGRRVSLRGTHYLAMDAKGRFAVPVRYREVLEKLCGSNLVVTIDVVEKCLSIYPVPEWDRIESELEKLSSLQPESRRLKGLLIGHANDIDVDGNGRVLLPAPLRDYAELDKKVVLVGQGKKLELWDEQNWNARRESWVTQEAGSDELPDSILQLPI